MNGTLSASACKTRSVKTVIIRSREAYKIEHDVGILDKAFDLVKLLMVPNDRFHAKLGLENLGFLGVADESSYRERAGVGMIEKSGEDSASDIACSIAVSLLKQLKQVKTPLPVAPVRKMGVLLAMSLVTVWGAGALDSADLFVLCVVCQVLGLRWVDWKSLVSTGLAVT